MEIKLDLNRELRNFLNKDKQYTIPIFIPHKGCPNSCVFCNQKRISGEIRDVTPNDVENTINQYLDYYDNKDKKIEVAFFGGSFTGIDFNLQREYLEIANKYLKSGRIDSIRLSTRPDYIDDNILRMVKEYGVKTIELGVQSMDNTVLEASNRGHTREDVIVASKKILDYGISLGHQIMIGLPNSSFESEVYTIRECLKLKPTQLRIYPVYVIEDSKLYDMYKSGKYLALTIEEAVRRCKAVIRECQNTNISIIRLGLQSTSEITASNSNIFGPVSDNFAEYVMADLIKDKINEIIGENEVVDNVIIYVPKNYISVTIGPNKINKKYFEQKYKVKYIIKGEI